MAQRVCVVMWAAVLQGELERQCFSTDLRRTVEAQTVYKAQLRIHVSKGSLSIFESVLSAHVDRHETFEETIEN